ncbi:MAG: ABC transporter ATP-binding protein [Lachnospiraceae bacterium]|nr:ABC transporter ATP-binding protein [Lachnospiraceae bacterium]
MERLKWSKYIKPYKAFFILGPLCMIVEVIGELVMPRLLGIVINGAKDSTLTVGTSLGIMGLMILTAVIMMAGGIGGAYFASKASVSFAADLREDGYRRIQQFSFANIDKFSTGSLVTRLTNDITQVQNMINMGLRMALRAPGMMIGALIMAIILNPPLSVVFAISVPAMLIVVGGIILTGFPRFGRVQKKVDGLNSAVQENVTNVRVVKSFVREDFETEKFHEANANLKAAGISASKVMIFMSPVMTLFMNGTVIAVVLLGGPMVLDEASDFMIGDLSAFLTYVTQILSSLVMVTFMLMFSSRALASAKRIREVMEEPLDLTDDAATRKDLTVQRGDITFKNVSFRYYKNSEEKVLNNINLEIAAGSTVGIIGSTGCGKTTLVSMIPRLYDCDEGEVLVDGVNVRDYSLYNLREGVSMVLQKNTLFSGTVRENLQWGDENATDEEIRRMAEYAQADKFVSAFKDGYDSQIEQGGTNVSGGQKQRLCIARALLKKPKILILDDSTSAVDTATEAQIRKAFSEKAVAGEAADPYTENLRKATKLIIAQRISSVQDADTIIVMDDGVITGMGTHDELLANNTEYREIYESQTGKGA